MNRRSFFSTLSAAVAGFAILPPATTYHRIWRTTRPERLIVNPDWESAPYEMRWMSMNDFWAECETGVIQKLPIMRFSIEPNTGDIIQLPKLIRSDV